MKRVIWKKFDPPLSREHLQKGAGNFLNRSRVKVRRLSPPRLSKLPRGCNAIV
jgi:hypothetical protein